MQHEAFNPCEIRPKNLICNQGVTSSNLVGGTSIFNALDDLTACFFLRSAVPGNGLGNVFSVRVTPTLSTTYFSRLEDFLHLTIHVLIA